MNLEYREETHSGHYVSITNMMSLGNFITFH